MTGSDQGFFFLPPFLSGALLTRVNDFFRARVSERSSYGKIVL